MNQLKFIATTFYLLLAIVFASFFYQGFISRNPVSLDYNVPIAKTILTGEFVSLHTKDFYQYFPGSSHVILSLFILVGVPNLFGVLSWIVLFFACKKLAEVFGVNTYMAIIFAGSFCLVISVVRTIGDQSIDKWLCSWFIFSLILLENPSKTWKFSLLIGLTLGMLVGTKYSGPLFLIPLFLVYGKRLLQFSTPLRMIATASLFTVTGLFWYLRNFFLTGTPYYPANLPFFKGAPHFTQQDWMLWKVPFVYPPGVFDILNALISEYLIWAFSGIVVLWFVFISFQKKLQIVEQVKRLLFLSFFIAIACLFLPVTPPEKIPLFHIISDMRYLYISIVIVMLLVFLLAEKYKKNNELGMLALINAIPAFSFVTYLPKIILLCLFLYIMNWLKPLPLFNKINKI